MNATQKQYSYSPINNNSNLNSINNTHILTTKINILNLQNKVKQLTETQYSVELMKHPQFIKNRILKVNHFMIPSFVSKFQCFRGCNKTRKPKSLFSSNKSRTPNFTPTPLHSPNPSSSLSIQHKSENKTIDFTNSQLSKHSIHRYSKAYFSLQRQKINRILESEQKERIQRIRIHAQIEQKKLKRQNNMRKIYVYSPLKKEQTFWKQIEHNKQYQINRRNKLLKLKLAKFRYPLQE